ncbi:hypothetical protein [Chryseobacterium sp. EO14]|nr:hypothetical protein [Chryseobacterium sp. EO14]
MSELFSGFRGGGGGPPPPRNPEKASSESGKQLLKIKKTILCSG